MIAYVLRNEEQSEVTDIRISHARQYFQSVNQGPLVETRVGDRVSGLIGWHPSDRKIQWRVHEKRNGNEATSWLHIPTLAGGPESGVDSWEMASSVLRGDLHPAELGAPFAVLRWAHGRLEIVNDILGLVRLFHFQFEDGDVWTSRQGLAHVFMGVSPERNSLAWAGMAALGWAPGGATHLGMGKQLPGGTSVEASQKGEERALKVESAFRNWLNSARACPDPGPIRNVEDMEQLMATAKRWPADVVADLSGGKDSRVGAALGIRSRTISAVRTINTDPGEVATARRLMGAIDTSIPHLVEERRNARPADQCPFTERLLANHRLFEGRNLPATAFNSGGRMVFRSATRPRFNGLGGEVLAGGNFQTGKWHAKMVGKPIEAARGRLIGMSHLGLASSASSKALLEEFIGGFVDMAEALGLESAGEALDLFYSCDKMPNWSLTFATDSNLCPLFAPSALLSAVHRMGDPRGSGDVHRELVREAIPEWDGIPFFKPSFVTRSSVPIWQADEWGEIIEFVRERLDSSEAHDAHGLRQVLVSIENGEGGRRHEMAIQAFLWDQTFNEYLGEVSVAASRVRTEIAAHRSAMPNEQH